MSKEKPFVRYKNWAEKHPILATTAETLGMVGVKYGIQKIEQEIDIKLGNANPAADEISKGPLPKAVFLFSVKAPLKEELVLRGIPHIAASELKKSDHEKTAKVAAATAEALFGLAHSGLFVRNEDNSIGTNFDVNRKDHALPVMPYISGLQYRGLTEKRGLGHAIYAHSLNNAFALAQRRRKNKKK